MGGRGSAGGGSKSSGSTLTSLHDRVYAAVQHAARNSTGFYKGQHVPVADVRDEMVRAGVSREDFDRTVLALHDQGRVQLYSSNASRMLTQRQRDGGLRFGGKNNQIVRLP
jgi:hypothetical protein